MTTGVFAKIRMRAVLSALALAGFGLTAPVLAQLGDGYKFIKAVKDRDLAEAEELINEGPTIVNTRENTTRRTALYYAIEDRYLLGARYLLQKGANPDHADKDGTTPMALAIRLNFTDAVESLIRHKANVNAPNRSGETPLIIAVQLDKPQIVRLLIKAGANPDITDNLAGLSARDYATRDPRKKHILSILEGTEAPEAAKTEKQGELDFSGFEEAK